MFLFFSYSLQENVVNSSGDCGSLNMLVFEQFNADLTIIQERWEDISVSHTYKIVRVLFCLENIKHFISSCHSLSSSTTSASGNSLTLVGLGHLRQNAILRVVVSYRGMDPYPFRFSEPIVVRHSARFLTFVAPPPPT